MAKLTQGTSLYWIYDGVVQRVAATNISGISAQRDSLETTDLTVMAKTFMPGLMSPGSAQFTIQFDPTNPVHLALHEAYKDGTTLDWALGWSDGTSVPTFSELTGDFAAMPLNRSFLNFKGFIQDVTFDFSINSIVSSNVSIQVSGMPTLHPATE